MQLLRGVVNTAKSVFTGFRFTAEEQENLDKHLSKQKKARALVDKGTHDSIITYNYYALKAIVKSDKVPDKDSALNERALSKLAKESYVTINYTQSVAVVHDKMNAQDSTDCFFV